MEAIKKSNTFDFDKWFNEYAILHTLSGEDMSKAREYILDIYNDLPTDEDLGGEQGVGIKKIIEKSMDETK